MLAAPSKPAAPAGLTPTSAEELFRFHMRSTNPELWRTTLPLIVRYRCERHKGLIATWMAIHWLIVLYTAIGRRSFGMREIALEAGVGRNELAGSMGHIQRLVDMGLIHIVGYEQIPGLRERRPVYHIDLFDLERQSIALIPELLRERGVAAPPRPAPDPRQTSFFDLLDDCPAEVTPAPANGTEAPANGTDIPVTPVIVPANGPVLPENGTVTPVPGTVWHQNVTSSPEPVTERAPDRDVEGMNERMNEGESRGAPARSVDPYATAATAALVIEILNARGLLPTEPPPAREAPAPEPPAAPETPPTPPEGQPSLPGGLFELWQGDRGPISRRDRHQLAMLAAEQDLVTGGYGAYWVGRAVLIAERCLGEHGQPLSINYVRGMLRRWQREGSWGSDLEIVESAPSRGAADATPRPAALSPSGAPGTGDQASPEAMAHPAVALYAATVGRAPNAVQAEEIAAMVTNLAAWREVLRRWQLNGWKETGVAAMLDRYSKDTGETSDSSFVSIAPIHYHPGLTMDERERWIRRFHRAETPAEKRAVLARLEQEHPR